MAAVIASWQLAVGWKPHLATTAVAVVVYSYLRSALNLSLSELLQLASPASAVALLGLVCFPFGLAAAYQASSGSSPQPKSSLSNETKQQQQQQPQCRQQEAPSMSRVDADMQDSLGSRPVKLAEPPFSGDLSVPLGSNRQLLSSSCKPRRRRLPRLSIELTPLPRLSVDFSGYRHTNSYSTSTYSRQASIRRSLDRGMSLMMGGGQQDPSGLFGGSCWAACPVEDWQQLSLSSAAAAAAGGVGGGQVLGGCASMQLQQQLPTHAVGEVTDSLGQSELPAGLELVGDIINETHLLQVGAMFGEPSARGALAAREAGGPVGHPSSFYGSADTADAADSWELLVSEGNDAVLYWGWRKPLRKGLYMYMTRSVFMGASPAELRAFMMDDAYRVVWDQSMSVLRPVLNADSASATAGARRSSSGGGSSCSNAAVEAMAAATAARMSAAAEADSEPAAMAGDLLGPNSSSGDSSQAGSGVCSSSSSQVCVMPHESAVMQAQVHFPKPMASRSYVYARRVWPRSSDGGCYCLSKACPVLDNLLVPALPNRSVSVEDYCSGCVIRAPNPQLLSPGADAAAPAAEVFMVYFEDSHVRAGLANLGIKKGLWPLVQRTEKALRVYQAGAAANMHLQPGVAAAGAGSAKECTDAAAAQCPACVVSPGPARVAVSRCASLGSEPMLQDKPPAAAAGALSRSLSLQADHTRRLSSASLPCFPLENGLLDDDEPVHVVDSCSCSCIHGQKEVPLTLSSDCGTAGSSCCPTPQPQQQQQEKPRSGSHWGWLGRVGSRVCGVIRQSGQLLAAASVVLWRRGPSVALLLPRVEWSLLAWAYSRISSAPCTRMLLGPAVPPAAAPAAGAVQGGCSVKRGAGLAHLNSHPLKEWSQQPVGLLGSVLSHRVVARLPSHPLTAEELGAAGTPSGIATVRSEPALQLRLAYAAAAAGSTCGGSTPGCASSVAGSTAGSDVASFSVCCSTCGCCCGGSTGGDSVTSSVSSSRRCHRSCSAAGSSSSSCGGGSVVHDESGGRRHRRVVVRLVQVAGMRVARKVARLTGISE